MARQYRLFHKREKYNDYTRESENLSQQLKKGELTQEQYERAMEMVDDKYRFVR